VADELDLAQAINEQFLADALAEHQRNRPTGPAATICEECGEEIPEKRRRIIPGCRRCRECQTLLENRRRCR